MRPVVITGIGAVSSLGLGRDAFWSAVVNGPGHFSRVDRFDTTGFYCQVGGQVDLADLERLVETPKRFSHATVLALAAAKLAVRDSGLSVRPGSGSGFPSSCGVIMGTALGGWGDAEQQASLLIERGARRVNPFVLTGAANHGMAVEIAREFGAHGPNMSFSSGCPSSLQAISHAAMLVATGVTDFCLAGGSESPLTPLTFASLSRTRELSAFDGADLALASRPFDNRHSGIVLSEGSCILVVEPAESARRRGQATYAEIVGGETSCDAQGMFGSDRSGEAGATAICSLLARSEITVRDIDYVCSHANGSPLFDAKEAMVLRRAFGSVVDEVPVSSIKAVLGHPFGASGAFQVAAAALAISNSLIPPTHNLEEVAPDCDLHHVPMVGRHAALRHALVSSYGYGGINAFTLLRDS